MAGTLPRRSAPAPDAAHQRARLLTSYGEAFNPDEISRMVTKYIKKADIRFIPQLLGHEKLETTAIYTQVSIEQLKDVHRRTHPAEKPKKPDSQKDEEPLS